MKRFLFLLLLGVVSAAAAPAGAKPNARADIEASLATWDLPANTDRTCVVDRAVEAYPNVPLTVVGPPLSGAARKLHEENIRRIRADLAVNAGIEACVPASTQGEKVDAQP
jgi:hypothetical protein